MTRHYYAFEYYAGRGTTAGEPNPSTGQCNIAGLVRAFPTAAERDAWVSRGKPSCEILVNCREAVKKRELRELRLGMDTHAFETMVAALGAVSD